MAMMNPTINYHYIDHILHDYHHTWQPIVFIQPGVQDMSIIIYAFKVFVEQY